MKNKVLWSSLIILCLILVTLFFVISTKRTPSPLCEPYLNIAGASKTGDIKSCDCLTDKVQIKQCQDTFSDAFIYTDAINRMDITGCENISKPEMKNTCIAIVKSKIDFATKANNLSANPTKQK